MIRRELFCYSRIIRKKHPTKMLTNIFNSIIVLSIVIKNIYVYNITNKYKYIIEKVPSY